MSNYKVVVLSREDDVACEGRRFLTKSDAEEALETCKFWHPDIVAEVVRMDPNDTSSLDVTAITFDQWNLEE